MAKIDAHSVQVSRNSKAERTRFPSLRLWEDPWEAGLNLHRLRAKSGVLATQRRLLIDARSSLPEINQAKVEALIKRLVLPEKAAAQLINDTALLADWYLLPDLLHKFDLGQRHERAALEAAAMTARQLYLELAPYALTFEDLIRSVPSETGDMIDDLDLVELAENAGRFARGAVNAVRYLGSHQAGRRRDGRRNVALALAVEAVEEATGQRVEIRKVDDWRFTNPSGQAVRAIMAFFGDWSERVLVGAFDRMRRMPRVNQTP